MKIDRQTDLALRMLLVAPDGLWSVQAAAEAIDSPANHVAKVVRRMRDAGWIYTRQGRGGGFGLTSVVATLTAGAVVRTLEGDKEVVPCVEDPCPLASQQCALRGALANAREAFLKTLDPVMISDLRAAQEAPPIGAVVLQFTRRRPPLA